MVQNELRDALQVEWNEGAPTFAHLHKGVPSAWTCDHEEAKSLFHVCECMRLRSDLKAINIDVCTAVLETCETIMKVLHCHGISGAIAYHHFHGT